MKQPKVFFENAISKYCEKKERKGGMLHRVGWANADLVFADPPYGISSQGKSIQVTAGYKTINKDWDCFSTLTDFVRFNQDWIYEAYRILHDHGSIYVTGTSHNIFVIKPILDHWFRFRNFITWQKPTSVPTREASHGFYAFSNEYILFYVKEGKPYFDYKFLKNDRTPEELKAGLKRGTQMRDIWIGNAPQGYDRVSVQVGDSLIKHETQKPDWLVRRCIIASCPKDGLVVDPFGGSGTTAYVATLEDRYSIIFEKDITYIPLIHKRLGFRHRKLDRWFQL